MAEAGWLGRVRERVRHVQPGLVLSATVAMAAMFLSEHYGVPVMLFALMLGMSFNSIHPSGLFMPGVVFASRTVLRIGVALLGTRITAEAVVELGWLPILLALIGVVTTIGLGVLLARALGRGPAFGVLTGGAVGICGASAALALSAVLPRPTVLRDDTGAEKLVMGISEQDTIFAVIAVTTLSTLAMVLYPIITTFLGFSNLQAGIFIGATVHDVAQVVGAGYTISDEAGDAATVTKLLRVMLLVPVVALITLFFFARRRASGALETEGTPRGFPPFLIAFIALVAFNSAGLIPAGLGGVLDDVSRWALVTAIAGLGMRTSLKELVKVGPKAMTLIVAETIWLAALVAAILIFWP